MDAQRARKLFDAEQRRLVAELEPTGILGMLHDLPAFLQHLPVLRTQPFMCALHGETLEHVPEVRARLISRFELVHNTEPRAKAEFVVWLRFKKTQQQVYLPVRTILDFCVKHGTDLELALECLEQHPKLPSLYTTRRLRQRELDVEAWVQRSSVLLEPEHIRDMTAFQALDDVQEACIQRILASPAMTLCGSAGCGKTLTVTEMLRRLTHCMQAAYRNTAVHAIAFTHKATQCLQARLLGMTVHVSTIHSFMGRLSSSRPAGDLFLVIDEASMTDLELLGELARAMLDAKLRYQLCFVGDPMQLPPVGRGEFFRQLVDAAGSAGCHLTRCYRTDDAVDIEANYQRLRLGSMPQASANFMVTVVQDEEQMSEVMRSHISRHGHAYKIICWQNQHIKLFNQWVQEARHRAQEVGPAQLGGIFLHDHVIYCGENNPEGGITNSSVGQVTGVSKQGIQVRWQSGAVGDYNRQEIKSSVCLAYALTAHKAQGSEYDRVIVPCYDVHKMQACLDRRWLYTAVTRGKRHVQLVVTPRVAAFVASELKPLPITNIAFDALAAVMT